MDTEAARLIGEDASPSEITQQWFLPAELIYFQGHFPNLPVLPGVVQLKWAIALAERLSNNVGKPLRAIKRLKFTNIIQPETTISLHLKYDLEKDFATFRYFDDKHVYSQGQLHCS